MTHADALRVVELFAGAGGLAMGLERAGMRLVGLAEIEPHARAVLRRHHPGVPLSGDVATLSGVGMRGGVDVIAGGSPCQDLSVAGKGAGLDGARSSLFFHQVRVWEESGAPYFLWENVAGALSSHQGEDFARVLGALVGADVAVPVTPRGRRGRWTRAGHVTGPAGMAAWRVLDLQHFGPPQRRRRVFVVAVRHPRTARVDPREILALGEGVCGHPAPREQARQAVAAVAGGGAPGGGGGGVAWAIGSHAGCADGGQTNRSHAAGGPVGLNIAEERAYALRAGRTQSVFAFHPTQTPISDAERRAALGTTTGGMGVLAMDTYNQTTGGVAHTLRDPHGTFGDALPAVVAFNTEQVGVVTVAGEGVTHALTYEGHDASEDGTGRGTPIVVPTIAAGAHPGGANGQDAAQIAHAIALSCGHARPRRLTPLECERLMGWPDHHTAIGVNEEGREYALSDAARYKLCGNGVGANVAHWIAARLVAAHAQGETTMATLQRQEAA